MPALGAGGEYGGGGAADEEGGGGGAFLVKLDEEGERLPVVDVEVDRPREEGGPSPDPWRWDCTIRAVIQT